MSSHWTEAAIREALDGTVTGLDSNGRVVTRKVAKDFVPLHEPSTGSNGGKGIPRENYRKWLPSETALLIELHAKGYTQIAIGQVLERHPRSIRRRIELLGRVW